MPKLQALPVFKQIFNSPVKQQSTLWGRCWGFKMLGLRPPPSDRRTHALSLLSHHSPWTQFQIKNTNTSAIALSLNEHFSKDFLLLPVPFTQLKVLSFQISRLSSFNGSLHLIIKEAERLGLYIKACQAALFIEVNDCNGFWFLWGCFLHSHMDTH